MSLEGKSLHIRIAPDMHTRLAVLAGEPYLRGTAAGGGRVMTHTPTAPRLEGEP
jgi:hypothetical protein